MTSARMPTFFLSHGGGPWPFMDGPWRDRCAWLERSLVDIPQHLPQRPSAVLVVSGHWEEPEFTVSSGEHPGMEYDYYGFPQEMYSIRYPAPGSPGLAQRTQQLLAQAGWDAKSDAQRGFDHGTFSLMKVMYPDADVPVVQLSLKATLDPDEHFRAGEAIAPLRDEGVLVIGSGLSYHNLRAFGPAGEQPSASFDAWLRTVMGEPDPRKRRQQLAHWQQAPGARASHPREDHLLPLHVVAGAAGDEPATCVYGELFAGALAVSSWRFSTDTEPSSFDRRAFAS
ncbi:DODA-type extradiol aromatic ring-opening family dioxygenase [Ramlibacter algicola]|uniref:Dioxygenase n=1 Tax=Ramlibacter algicola TaxID=2795217 RepID=A0A934Q0A0_9BURK|nr:class III extradiol ring-cleavage dioxygenase [Ramlibacter algicola]MBK0392805.1 dioxygenase [Ramlibacter algicola]